jgi:acetyltransferase-like isoleucine patch superfamily enzyme
MKFDDVLYGLFGLPWAIAEAARRHGRWAKATRLFPSTRFGKGVRIGRDCAFEEGVVVRADTYLERASVGKYSYVGTGSTLWNCSLGRYCSVGPEVRIGLGIHPVDGVISTYPGFYTRQTSVPISFGIDENVCEHKKVFIGSDVWIGARAMVLDGVKVGHGAVIGAGAIVTRDIEPY